MQQQTPVVDRARRRAQHRAHSRRIAATAVLAVAVVMAGIVAVTTLTARNGSQHTAVTRVAVRTEDPAATVSELAGSPVAEAAGLARLLFARAPAVVAAASTATPAQLSAAAAAARRAHAPLLLTPLPAGSGAAGATGAAVSADRAALLAAIRALRPEAVLAAGLPVRALAAELPRVRVVGSLRSLPATRAPLPLHQVDLLADQGAEAADPALIQALATTATVAGAGLISETGYDPRTDPTAISALAAARPQHVIGVGAGFGPESLLAARVAVAETGVQLPGGGQVLFPGREIVALYGTPTYPALGVLGHQGLQASIARAKAVAAQYDGLTSVPVVPAFEIIATVASAGPGNSGQYSQVLSPASLRPWVTAASQAGLYVTLDLQPGRASLLAQAKEYQSLLELPGVGLALDPEWKLLPNQLPLRQIGSVSIAEVNSVASWLAALTAQYHLPQKLLELHEFRLSMIRNIGQLDTSYDDLAIVINMDGQGSPSSKRQTWRAVVAGAPKGVFFGWKDFYVKDTPMLGPRQTLAHAPRPVLISYQ